MFMIMLGFTFFSASMWVGQQLADGLDFQRLRRVDDRRRPDPEPVHGTFGLRGRGDGHEPRPSGPQGVWRQEVRTCRAAMISFTQIGWFGVGIAMFAIPVANELLGGSTDGGVGARDRCGCLHDGLGLLRHQVAHARQLYRRPDGGGAGYGRDGARRHAAATARSIDQFAKSSGTLTGDRRRRTGCRLVRLRRHGDAELLPLCPKAARWARSQR